MRVEFAGFSREGLAFLADLAANNDRTWFAAHRQVYQVTLLEPAQQFVTALGERLQVLAPALQVDPRTDGRGTLMRLTRDLRFSRDKRPYRTELSGLFWESSGEKTASPAFGFRLRADGMDLMAGMFAFSPVALPRFRTAVADPDMGEVLAQLAEFLQAQPGYTLQGEQYQRVPSGYDASHPHATLLRYKGLYVTPPPLGIDTVCSDQLVDVCIARFQVIAPLYQWLADVLNSAAPGADD